MAGFGSGLAGETAAESSRRTALAQHRISQLAARLAVHRAFRWLHLHEPQMRAWQMELLAIPAPPFGEDARAAWFAERFRELGLEGVERDGEGNVLGLVRNGAAQAEGPVVLLSAHLDTVFSAGVNTMPREDGGRILGPGACDNGAGLAGLLGLVAAVRAAELRPGTAILFAANVGEEGEGDLRGMRFLFERGAYAGRIQAALALEGAGTVTAVARALGSRRYRLTVSGPGGHSWTDAATPNPILLVAEGLVLLRQWTAGLAEANGADGPRTTLSPGCISGGTSVNSIPAEASVLLDLRSTDASELVRCELEIHRTFEGVVAAYGGGSTPVRLRIEAIGQRPAAELALDSPLLGSLRAVDRHLGLRTELRLLLDLVC